MPRGACGVDSEIPLFDGVCSNQIGKNDLRQYLVGSFSGALSS